MADVEQSCPQGVAIRTLTSADTGLLREVAALMLAAWGQSPTVEELDRRAMRLNDELQSMGRAVAAMFGAWSAGRLVGFGRAMQDKQDARSWWLFAVAVHPEHRRQRIATALARAAIAYAMKRGAESIQSQTHADNLVSIQWHLSMGFVNEGTVTAADGDRLVQFRIPLR
jgi:ribosomal protein S18 acetylase RimI-like enzyme